MKAKLLTVTLLGLAVATTMTLTGCKSENVESGTATETTTETTTMTPEAGTAETTETTTQATETTTNPAEATTEVEPTAPVTEEHPAEEGAAHDEHGAADHH